MSSSWILATLLSATLPSGLAASNLTIESQVTGAETNCYLVYDRATREAALFDVGGPIDSLLASISDHGLTLRYFFFTHGHHDHFIGLPAIRDSFPAASVCMHRRDFENMQGTDAWADTFFTPEVRAELEKDPEMKKIMDFDEVTFGTPDVFVEDGQRFLLGRAEVVAYHCPGHSPGGVCFHVANALFSGNVLFKGTVGRVDLLNGSREAQIQSEKPGVRP